MLKKYTTELFVPTISMVWKRYNDIGSSELSMGLLSFDYSSWSLSKFEQIY